jgi:hypothetical protein
MQHDIAHLKASVPRSLKCKVYYKLSLLDLTYKAWLQQQLEAWLAVIEAEERHDREEPSHASHVQAPR